MFGSASSHFSDRRCAEDAWYTGEREDGLLVGFVHTSSQLRKHLVVNSLQQMSLIHGMRWENMQGAGFQVEVQAKRAWR